MYKTHYLYYGLEDSEVAMCGTLIPGDGFTTTDWSLVSCQRCVKNKEKIMKSLDIDERSILDQMEAWNDIFSEPIVEEKMKISIVNSAIRTAALIALAQNKSFEIVDAASDVCSNADGIKKLHAHHHNDEFSREFRLIQKSINRKKQKKPARGGGKP